MGLYSEELADEIISLYKSGNYKIEDICKKVGIATSTFYFWQNDKPEFLEAIKAARKERVAAFAEMAHSGLAKLLDVHEYEEIVTEYVADRKGKPKLKSMKKVKRQVMPNVTAVMYALNNQDSENFKHKDARRDDEEGDGATRTIVVREG